MLKLKEIFSNLAGRGGLDSETKLRAAIAKVEAEITSAQAELAGIGEQRTQALLEDDDPLLDKLDRRAEALHRCLERADFAMPELQQRLEKALARSDEARRASQYAEAKKALHDAECRLVEQYDQHARAIVELVAATAGAVAAARRANEQLPDGQGQLLIPSCLTGRTPEQPETIVATEEVTRWVYAESGELVADQEEAERCGGQLHPSMSHGVIRCIRRRLLMVTYRPRDGASSAPSLVERLSLPSPFNGTQDYWRPQTGFYPAEVQREAELSLALERLPTQEDKRPICVRYEPLQSRSDEAA